MAKIHVGKIEVVVMVIAMKDSEIKQKYLRKKIQDYYTEAWRRQ